MSLLGEVILNNIQYFLYNARTKNEELYYLISTLHKDDIVSYNIKGEHSHTILNSKTKVESAITKDYILAGIKKNRKSGKIWEFGNSSILNNILDTIFFAKTYTFRDESIMTNETSLIYGKRLKTFSASDKNLIYSFSLEDNLYKSVQIKSSNAEIKLDESKLVISKKFFTNEDGTIDPRFVFVLSTSTSKKRISVNTLDSITYEKLKDLLDLSWYQLEDGTFVKDYQTIETIRDFELKIMTPIIKKLMECKENDTQLDISVDTETTGLTIFNLSKDNPDLDHCVAIPICWEDDKSYVIFTDMEFFNNIDNQYAIDRLACLFENFKGEREIIYYEESSNSDENIKTMDLFGDSIPEETSAPKLVTKKFTFFRNLINLIGHNAMFDGKVFYLYGREFYFNNDTLQMAFNLNPKQIKASNKLKALTHRIFGHETPELSDILGKGNEDKYKYISDKRVASIYGCADSDYTRKLFRYLKGITSQKMYNYYQQQDIPILNILYKSEFYGMRTTEDQVLRLAEISKENIERLKEFMYSYVGKQVAYNEQRHIIEEKYKSGYYSTYEDYQLALQTIYVPEDSKYVFDVKSSTKRHVMYDILRYKIYAWTDGKNPLPKADKYVMKKLSREKRDGNSVGFGSMTQDLITVDITREKYNELKKTNKKLAAEYCLISAEEFNQCRNPLAVVLLKYSELDKEYTSYYKPIVEKNLEGKMFYGYSMARIETRRIANPGQTMKGKLKALIRAYSDDYYLLDFDMSQAEYRIMVSLAKYTSMIHKMDNPESDYHIETASLVNDIPAHMVSKKLRKQTKSISFGVPYGLSEHSLCENIFGSVNEDNMFLTRRLLQKWYSSNQPISDMLEEVRNNALVEREISNDLRDFMGAWKKDDNGRFSLDENGNRIPIPLGFVENPLGFYRTFDLDDMDRSKESTIRRAAGNFPIQSFAAEVFRIILIRFYNRCIEEGINDKIIWHMLIHDELLCSVHKSLNPFYMYKLVKESCMITFKGHTKYFIGINIGNTWAETKDDAREAPIYFVDRIIKRWDAGEWKDGPYWFDDPWSFIEPYRKQFIGDRIYEVIKEIQPDIDTEPINIPLLLDNFTNYTVRAYVKDYPKNHSVDFSKIDKNSHFTKDDVDWSSHLESWIIERFGEGKEFIDCDGTLNKVFKQEVQIVKKVEKDAVYYEDLFNSKESIFTYDESELEHTYEFDVSSYNDEESEEGEKFDLNSKGNSVADFILTEDEYENISIINNHYVIRCKHPKLADICKLYLNKNRDDSGSGVIFKISGIQQRWLKIKTELDLHNLDKFISKCNAMSNNEFSLFLKNSSNRR